ncbi:hypothetical protein Drorol1_Dr00013905 [Drosera rotundifolia]
MRSFFSGTRKKGYHGTAWPYRPSDWSHGRVSSLSSYSYTAHLALNLRPLPRFGGIKQFHLLGCLSCSFCDPLVLDVYSNCCSLPCRKGLVKIWMKPDALPKACRAMKRVLPR